MIDLETMIFLGVAGGVVAFLLLRYVWLWYFRINEAVALLKRIADKVAPEEAEPAPQPEPFTPKAPQA